MVNRVYIGHAPDNPYSELRLNVDQTPPDIRWGARPLIDMRQSDSDTAENGTLQTQWSQEPDPP